MGIATKEIYAFKIVRDKKDAIPIDADDSSGKFFEGLWHGLARGCLGRLTSPIE
jgi:hypothetical protein